MWLKIAIILCPNPYSIFCSIHNCSDTFHKCSDGLGSGDFVSHVRALRSLSCSVSHSWMVNLVWWSGVYLFNINIGWVVHVKHFHTKEKNRRFPNKRLLLHVMFVVIHFNSQQSGLMKTVHISTAVGRVSYLVIFFVLHMRELCNIAWVFVCQHYALD